MTVLALEISDRSAVAIFLALVSPGYTIYRDRKQERKERRKLLLNFPTVMPLDFGEGDTGIDIRITNGGTSLNLIIRVEMLTANEKEARVNLPDDFGNGNQPMETKPLFVTKAEVKTAQAVYQSTVTGIAALDIYRQWSYAPTQEFVPPRRELPKHFDALIFWYRLRYWHPKKRVRMVRFYKAMSEAIYGK
ncbi:MAG: hypothetical protein J0H98_03240 [Solirubrobacterales bacterium]|nr:hypothetical protein [Solirubrobacterales bacterium]